MLAKTLNTKEAADYLGLPEATLATWRHRKTGPRYLRMGSRIFYKQEDLEAFIVVVDPQDKMTLCKNA